MLLTADFRAEEAARKTEVEEKRQREMEVLEAEKVAAEMAELLNSDPEVHNAGVLFVFCSLVAPILATRTLVYRLVSSVCSIPFPAMHAYFLLGLCVVYIVFDLLVMDYS